MIEKMIVDADLCIKLGGSDKYRFLYDVLPMVAKKIYMHTHAHSEVMMPSSAVSQLKALVSEGKVELVNESELDAKDIYTKLGIQGGRQFVVFDVFIQSLLFRNVRLVVRAFCASQRSNLRVCVFLISRDSCI